MTPDTSSFIQVRRSQASYGRCHNPVPALQKGRGFPWEPANSQPHRMAPVPLQSDNLGTMLNMQGISPSFPKQVKLRVFVCWFLFWVFFLLSFSLWGCQRQHSWENVGSLTQSVLILIPDTTLTQFISPDSVIQSGRQLPVLILLFSECAHPAHNKPHRKSSTSLTAVSYRFKNRVWATFGTHDGEQNQAHNDSMPHIRYCCPLIQST